MVVAIVIMVVVVAVVVVVVVGTSEETVEKDCNLWMAPYLILYVL